LRSESLLRTVLEDRMEGTRTHGRQSATMIDWMKSNDVEYEHIKKSAHDREDWREIYMTVNYCISSVNSSDQK